MEDSAPIKVVAIGGGTGLSSVLHGLKHYTHAADLATHPRRSHRARNVALATAAAVAAGAAYARLRPAPLPDLVFEETDVVSATAGP